MTQKPPEMPQEAWFQLNTGWNTLEQTIDGAGTRYILAEPKEDVERALEALPDPDRFTHGNRIMVELKFDELRTIRRVLLANAGRKE